MDGFFIIDKPTGITSHDVVDFIRNKFHIKKVGHAGTLDPMATGVLVLLLGRATKKSVQFSNFDKEYEAILTLGIVTDTGDAEGQVVKTDYVNGISKETAEEVFNRFVGETEQIPPMFSALKYKGERLYNLARSGISVERSSRKIKINFLKLLDFSLPHIKFSVHCSKGTYIRKLGEDIGSVLGCGGHISQIRRISVGPFHIKDALKLNEVNESHLRN